MTLKDAAKRLRKYSLYAPFYVLNEPMEKIESEAMTYGRSPDGSFIEIRAKAHYIKESNPRKCKQLALTRLVEFVEKNFKEFPKGARDDAD
jgi:hypothetical protein